MFKDKLIELRKQNNDTQESLAKKLNVSRSLVAKWEQNRAYPSNEDLDNIAKIYNVNYEELMSDKELKKIYGIVLKNSKKKNLIIMILSMVFSLLTIILVIINLVPSKKYIFMEKDEVTTGLINYKNNSGNDTTFRGESEWNNFMMNSELYTWEKFQIDRIEFTDVSSLYILHYIAQITPGVIAYSNDNEGFNKDAYLDALLVELKFNDYTYVRPIYGWPNNKDSLISFTSSFSNNIILDKEYASYGVTIKNKDGKISLNYNYSFDLLNIYMEPGYDDQWIDFDYNKYSWDFKMINDYSKWATFHGQFHLLFEVKESETNEFSFSANKVATTKEKNKFTITNHSTIYNCNIIDNNESV